jgi:mannose PTS system EIIA component
MRIGVVVVTHGQLAAELLNSAEMIVGDLPQFAAVSIGWHDGVEQAREEIEHAIVRVRQNPDGTADETMGVVVLTDMFGGTPANLAITFLETDKVEVITGVNLAMLIKLARPPQDIDLLSLAREMREHGRTAIWVASDLIRGEKG